MSTPTPTKIPKRATEMWVCVNTACKEYDSPRYAVDTSRNGDGFSQVKCGSCWQPCEARPLPVQQAKS